MKAAFWGVRGSIPVPGPSTVKYGGNTTCYEVVTDSDELFILDAGTGIRELGGALFPRLGRHPRINLMITHTHWDHLIGFPFFGPAYAKGNKIDVYGPIHYDKSLQGIFATLMDYAYFPVSATQLNAPQSVAPCRASALVRAISRCCRSSQPRKKFQSAQVSSVSPRISIALRVRSRL